MGRFAQSLRDCLWVNAAHRCAQDDEDAQGDLLTVMLSAAKHPPAKPRERGTPALARRAGVLRMRRDVPRTGILPFGEDNDWRSG